MIKRVLPLAVVLALGACGGAAVVGPADDDGDGAGPGTTPAVPAAILGNVQSVNFDGTTMKVKVQLLDSTPVEVTYDRAAMLDRAGYTAYSIQEDPLDRIFIAMGKVSDDGSAFATTVADGGQFNRYFGGATYGRTGAFDKPTITDQPGSGQVSYAGRYVALTNVPVRVGNPADIKLPVPVTVDPDISRPQQSSRVEGDVFFNVNFADGGVNGQINHRRFVETAEPLAKVILVPTTMDLETGTFEGGAEREDHTPVGTYAGIFGGTDANSMAGGTYITSIYRADDTLVERGEERGIFVLTQCGPNNTTSPCDIVAP